jgi:hypothetical protein
MSYPLKVIQWATGNIGTRSLRAVMELDADCVLYMPQATDFAELSGREQKETKILEPAFCHPRV